MVTIGDTGRARCLLISTTCSSWYDYVSFVQDSKLSMITTTKEVIFEPDSEGFPSGTSPPPNTILANKMIAP